MRKNWLLIACLSFCSAVFSQQYPLVFYTPRDGLANSRVRSIKQDSKGRMYFLTYGGLSVYDGTKFLNYTSENGLPAELINDMVQAGPDSMLIATNASQLNTLVRGRVGIFKPDDNFCPLINRFLKSSDGYLYVTSEDGLYRLEGRKFVKLPMGCGRDENFHLNLDKIVEWKNFFLVTSWNKSQPEQLIVYDKTKKRCVDIFTKEAVVNAGIMKSGGPWMTTVGKAFSIDTSALKDGILKTTDITLRDGRSPVWDNAAVLFDNLGNYWLSKKGNIINLSVRDPQTINPAQQGLKAASLNEVFVDREGVVWMAFDGTGIVKMTGTNVQFINSLEQEITASVYGLHEQNDTIWFYNFENNSVYRYWNNEYKPFKLGKKINAVDVFCSGQAIYLNNGLELYHISNKNAEAAYQQPRLVLPNPAVPIQIGTGIVAPDGTLINYLRPFDSGHIISALHNKKLLHQQPLSYAADQLAIDGQGRLWVVSRDNRLHLFKLHPETPGKYFQLIKIFSDEVKNFNARSITIDQKGGVWIGTRFKGIFHLQFDDTTLISVNQVTTRDGLTDNFIYRLSCDDANNIWAGTQTGLDKIIWKDGKYLVESITRSRNFFQVINRIVTGENNTIWATSNIGSLIKISTTSSFNTSTPPEVLLTSLLVNDHDPGNNSQFSHEQNNVTISVAAPSFIDERSIRYSYLLKGSSKESWSQSSNNSTFNFINLSPGSYELAVKAEFPASIYPPQFLYYSFTIQPPFWQTWWFRILAAALIGGILVALVRFYYLRKLEKEKVILERQQAIEKERTRIATDMHDDLGAGLSRIKFLSETIGFKKQQHLPVDEEIGNIRRYSHEMIDKMGEIVWALNEKNDSLNDLLAYTRAYAVEYLSENGLSCSVTIPEEFPSLFFSGEFRRNIYLVVKEALHNIVKHAGADHVTINMEINRGLEIVIRDNGIGFDPAKKRPYSNGLTNMQRRMKEIGGYMTMQRGDGTTIILFAPLSK